MRERERKREGEVVKKVELWWGGTSVFQGTSERIWLV